MLNKFRNTMHKVRISTKRNLKKEPNRNTKAEEYNRTERFYRGVQQQTNTGRKESVNLKTGYLKLYSQRSKKENKKHEESLRDGGKISRRPIYALWESQKEK